MACRVSWFVFYSAATEEVIWQFVASSEAGRVAERFLMMIFLRYEGLPPNTALEPTPVTPVCPLRGSRRRRRGSAFGR